ncbi:Sirohydrochlorin ferrochelatase [Saccharopolyspora antimicrobica]|uniref:Sirohydrochlorin ferrochelatase n=1 Tax=Saccharopolyspora antimicrobica TaxID=455193 RepID=A0A1I4QQP5_9PSEU|nr:sirohydrochlorin chelatase [Saccharopolyspora antimicrobica]RKT88337.1 sirohydrochlorin ferrochelatase [Saccharopolyspora antimicrobica]SFM42341.1 Sirohydrochlorin ferrochelatase [Saccharopolyspora antimicrobica]
MNLLLVAHGTRDPAGPRVVERLAAAAAERLGVPVRVGYVDVIGPTAAEALESLDGPVVVVPAFLAAGYHVRTDLPGQIAACGRPDVVLAPALGPAPKLVEAMRTRLDAAGWRPGKRIVLSAAGSSDARALADVRVAARLLGRRCGQWPVPSFVTTAAPATAEVCGPADFIAPYLLAPGLFHRRLAELPVAGLAEPIGDHPAVVRLVARRYRQARRVVPAA